MQDRTSRLGPDGPPSPPTEVIDAGRLGRLSRAQLQSALDAFDLGALRDARVAEGGGSSRTLFVTTERGAFVLRGFPRPGDTAEGADGDPAKERAAAALLRPHVPVPWPWWIEERTDRLGFPFALVPRLPGLCFLSADARRSLTGDDPQLVAAALGRGLAALHGIARDAPARWDPTRRELVPEERRHADRIADEVRAKLGRARALGPDTTNADAAWSDAVLAAARPALDAAFPAAFVHRDFALGNALFQRSPDGWRLAGVLDLSDWCFGDPEEDLPRAVFALARIRPLLAARLLEAYTHARPLRPGFRERFLAHALSERLDVWLHSLRRGRREPAGFRAWAEPFLRLPVFGRDAS